MATGDGYALTAASARPLSARHRARRVGLDGVLADLDRAGEACPVPGAAAGAGLTWDAADRVDPAWWPQGVAAVGTGAVLLVSWYRRRRPPLPPGGVRISVVDRTDPERPRYRHVRLVAPRWIPGLPGLGAVRVHAGGIAVCGETLLVADTLSGVRVFRLGDVLRRRHEYVLPQAGAYRLPLGRGPRRLRFSFLSAGDADGRPTLVVGEYRRAADAAPRLARYPLDPATGLPAVDERGRTVAPEVHDDQPRRMQGAAVHGSTWFLSASAGEGVAGDLYVGAPGRWTRHRGALPTGPEDLAWSRPGEELWSVTEAPGNRWVYPIDVRRWRRPSDGG
ncbi:UNVERIFIED_ORG: hypothetical protein E4P37_03870 [Bacillus sp. AZ43]